MILLVFEGTDAEPKIFDSIGKLFLSDEELCIVRCGFDLPTLYSRLNKYGEDLFRCLPLEKNGIVVPEGRRLDTLFSQIFLFFDYDFQNRMGLKKLNEMSPTGAEQRYIQEAFSTNWIAPLGPNVDAFEEALARYFDRPQGVETSHLFYNKVRCILRSFCDFTENSNYGENKS